jgi:Uncharacterized conserved protein
MWYSSLIFGVKGMYEKRFYRDSFKGGNLIFFDVCIYETDLCIGASSNLQDIATRYAEFYRHQLEEYIKVNPDFLTSLVPITAGNGAPEIIKHMCDAAEKAKVGPMAAVAGAISELVGLELLKFSDEVIVENGGDIFMSFNTTRRVGIYAGKSPLSDKLSLMLTPNKSPLGICTSSGTVGHSLSFGKADAALIISKDTFLADAVATATGNIVKTHDDIEKALNFAAGIEGIEGALVIIGNKLGAWGDIKLV